MIESTEDLFHNPAAWSAIVITTNGSLKQKQAPRNGTPVPRGVMGRGVAALAKAKYPWVERRLGELVASNGNHCHILCMDPQLVLVSFPVKHEWHEKADLELIAQSVSELQRMATLYEWTKVLLPRPGCGNGGRTWEEVKPLLASALDDRFVVTHQPTPRESRSELRDESRETAAAATAGSHERPERVVPTRVDLLRGGDVDQDGEGMMDAKLARLRPDRIYVRLKTGQVITFAVGVSPDYLVGRLQAMGVERGGIRDTIHVISREQQVRARQAKV